MVGHGLKPPSPLVVSPLLEEEPSLEVAPALPSSDELTLVSSSELESAVSVLEEVVFALDVALLELVLEFDAGAVDVEVLEEPADDAPVTDADPVAPDVDVESPTEVTVWVDELCGISLTVVVSSLAAQAEAQ